MAFVNEKLTLDQQKEVNSWGISYHLCSMGQILTTMKLENPWEWTIDKERKIYLFGVYYLRDYYEENVFVFIWKKNNILYNSDIAGRTKIHLFGIFQSTMRAVVSFSHTILKRDLLMIYDLL